MRQRRHLYATTLSFGSEDNGTYSEVDAEVSYLVRWGAPEQGPSYASGGQPADPDEIDDLRLEKVNDQPRPWGMYDGWIPNQDEVFEATVIDRLEGSDHHYARMLEAAAEDELSERDDYFESLAEERRMEANHD